MSGIDILLDSNVLIYLSKGDFKLDNLEKYGKQFRISIITLMEVKGYTFKNSKEQYFIEELCDIFDTVYIDSDIADKVIELRRHYKIKLPDAIIAATALVCDAKLITEDTKHFRRVMQKDQIISVSDTIS